MRLLASCTLLASFVLSVAAAKGNPFVHPQARQQLLSMHHSTSSKQTTASCGSQMLDSSLPSSMPPNYNYSGVVRKYYVAAEYVNWNYAPSGYDNWLGLPLNESYIASASGYTSSSSSLGITNVLKAQYIGYTDATFTQRTEQPEWLGLQGPIMRAELGDMVQILLLNNMSNHYVSLHGMGPFYNKMSEGTDEVSSVRNGMAYLGGMSDAIAPGSCGVTKWLFPNTIAPAPGTNSRVAWYHSSVNAYVDINAGLSGACLIYNRGTMNSTTAQNKEFILNYNAYIESASFLAQQNVEANFPSMLNTTQNLSLQPASMISSQVNQSVWLPKLTNSAAMLSSSAMSALPTVYAINGMVLNNLGGLQLTMGDTAIWYLYNPGEMPHVAHWHGNNVMYNNQYHAVVPLAEGEAQTVTMSIDNPGNWAVICHVLDHLNAGMQTNYVVAYSNDTVA